MMDNAVDNWFWRKEKLQATPDSSGTKPIQVLVTASNDSKNSGTKKEVEYDLLSCLAPLTVDSCKLN